MRIQIELEPNECFAFYDALFARISADDVRVVDKSICADDAEIDEDIKETDEEIDEEDAAYFEDLCSVPPLQLDEEPAISISDTARLGDKNVLLSLALYQDFGEDRVAFTVTDCDSTGDILYRVQAERSQFAYVIFENIYAQCALDLFKTLSDFFPESD